MSSMWRVKGRILNRRGAQGKPKGPQRNPTGQRKAQREPMEIKRTLISGVERDIVMSKHVLIFICLGWLVYV